MSIYPTLTDLCGIDTPQHVEGPSLRPLLADPAAAWDTPAMTTYRFKNHTIRSEGWRLIRYENGDEELYNEATDPNEWTNLVQDPEYAAMKKELAKFLPGEDTPDIGNAQRAGRRRANRTRGATPQNSQDPADRLNGISDR
jgi:arylsulfatase A-like enzyme